MSTNRNTIASSVTNMGGIAVVSIGGVGVEARLSPLERERNRNGSKITQDRMAGVHWAYSASGAFEPLVR